MLYLPTNKTSSNRKKEKKKSVCERSYKHLSFKVFTILGVCYPDHSVIESLEQYLLSHMLKLNIKIWLLSELATC